LFAGWVERSDARFVGWVERSDTQHATAIQEKGARVNIRLNRRRFKRIFTLAPFSWSPVNDTAIIIAKILTRSTPGSA
jgi:hypothetical protein